MQSPQMLMQTSKIIFIAFTLFLTSCSTSNSVGYAWFGTSVDHDWGTGGEIWSHSSTYTKQKIADVANNYCKKGNLPPPSYSQFTSPAQNGSEYYRATFECGGLRVIQTTNPVTEPVVDRTTPTQSEQYKQKTENTSNGASGISVNIDEAKSKCLDLGFKQSTEAFGKCVLRLSK